MKFGFMYYGVSELRIGDVLEYARAVETIGMESFWVPEHQALYLKSVDDMAKFGGSFTHFDPAKCHPDSLQVLAAVAGVTERLILGSFLLLPCHQPVPLAKSLATLDSISGGRVRLSVGVGDLPGEVQACGGTFSERGKWTDEAIQVLRLLWTGDPEGVSFHGEHFNFEELISRPVPVQKGGIRIDIGGGSTASALRAGRFGDGLYPNYVISDDQFRTYVALARSEAERVGRDPESIEISRTAFLGSLTNEYFETTVEMGVSRIILMGERDSNGMRVDDVSRTIEQLQDVAMTYMSR